MFKLSIGKEVLILTICVKSDEILMSSKEMGDHEIPYCFGSSFKNVTSR